MNRPTPIMAYILPPGPYSNEWPRFCYTSLIGQAILSSPSRCLTERDICRWIATVYPYYTSGGKAGTPTWKKSVANVLRRFPVFRKASTSAGLVGWFIERTGVSLFENGKYIGPNVKPTVTRRLSPEEMGALREAIISIQDSKAQQVIQIIRDGVPEVRDSTEDVELELATLPEAVLERLYRLTVGSK